MEFNLAEDDELFDEDTLENKYLFFSVDKEIYGIKLEYVFEIIGMQDITHVPRLPRYMRGLINLRGSIIPVMDLRIRFQKEILEYTGRTSIVIISFGESTLGIIVDKAMELGNVLPDEILPPPELVTGYHNEFVSGVYQNGEKIRLLIDCEKLLTKEELTDIMSGEYKDDNKN